MHKSLLSVVLFFICLSGFCQTQQDTVSLLEEPVRQEREHSPRKAAIFSAVLPGLGQIYNGGKQWIKVPFIYAGLGTTTYFVFENHNLYQEAREQLRNVDPDSDDAASLRLDRDFYRRNRDLSIILTGLVYGLNILDANVFAHMRTFRFTEDLSLNVNPFFYPVNKVNLATGLTFSLTYK